VWLVGIFGGEPVRHCEPEPERRMGRFLVRTCECQIFFWFFFLGRGFLGFPFSCISRLDNYFFFFCQTKNPITKTKKTPKPRQNTPIKKLSLSFFGEGEIGCWGVWGLGTGGEIGLFFLNSSICICKSLILASLSLFFGWFCKELICDRKFSAFFRLSFSSLTICLFCF